MIRSEDHILALLDEYFPRGHKSLRLGRGDDCAELEPCGPLAVSTDLFLEDVHFRRSYFSPKEIGHKALAVNLSDLAAAGAAPLGFSLGLICPNSFPAGDLRGIFQGMSSLAGRFDMALTGGDISAGDKLGFSVTVLGTPVGEGLPFLRRGCAEPGDLIFTVGPDLSCCSLGLARNGLLLLEEQGRAAINAAPTSCSALLRPQPQIRAGLILAGLRKRMALMDLSDGLLRDLPRLLGGLGAELDFAPCLLHPELGENAVELAFSGGDDYLLLGAADSAVLGLAAKLLYAEGLRLDPIGIVRRQRGLFRLGESLVHSTSVLPFDHFEGKDE